MRELYPEELAMKHLLDGCCTNSYVQDLAYGLRDGERHFYCCWCQSHAYNGRKYTKKEWETWVNS